MDKLVQLVPGKTYKFYKEELAPKVFVCGGGNVVSENFYSDAYEIGKIIASLDAAYIQGGVSDRKTIMGESYYWYIDTGGTSAYFISRKIGTEAILKDMHRLKGMYEVEDIGALIKAQYI